MPKDKRVVAKRGATDLASVIDGVMSGKTAGREGAESAAFKVLINLIETYLMGEGPLADNLRALVDAIQLPSDPLRKDIPREAWSALWPTINTLASARREAMHTMVSLAEKQELMDQQQRNAAAVVTPTEGGDGHGREEGSEGEGDEGQRTGPEVGAGVLGDGGAAGAVAGEEGGPR